MSARAPAKIFLVEDEPMIRMLVVEMLEAIGYRVMAEAGDMTAALDLARTIECDLAILDVNIDGHAISPVAELLRTRQIPIIFATGYDSSSLPPRSSCVAETIPDRDFRANNQRRATAGANVTASVGGKSPPT